MSGAGGGQEARAHSPLGSLQRHRSGSSGAGENLLGAAGQARCFPSIVATLGGTTSFKSLHATDEETLLREIVSFVQNDAAST